MTLSNETPRRDLFKARRRGSRALLISTLCGAAAIAVLVVVLLSVYNTEKKYIAGVRTLAGLETDMLRLREERTTLSGMVERLNREVEAAYDRAEAARPAAAALVRDAAARDAAVEERNRAEAEQRRIEEKKRQIAAEIEKLGKERDALVDTVATLARSRDAESEALDGLRERRQTAEAATSDALKRQTEAQDRARASQQDNDLRQKQAEVQKAEMARLSADLQGGRNALTDQQRQLASLNQQHTALAEKVGKQQQLLAGLEEQTVAKAARAQQLSDDIDALTEKHDRLAKDAEVLESALKWLEPRVAELGTMQAKSADIRNAHAKARQSQQELNLQLEASRKTAAALQGQIAAQKETLAELTARESAVKQALLSIQAEDKTARQALDQRRDELKSVETKLDELQRRLEATRSERSTVSANLAELTVSRDVLQKELAELHKQIGAIEAAEQRADNDAAPTVE